MVSEYIRKLGLSLDILAKRSRVTLYIIYLCLSLMRELALTLQNNCV